MRGWWALWLIAAGCEPGTPAGDPPATADAAVTRPAPDADPGAAPEPEPQEPEPEPQEPEPLEPAEPDPPPAPVEVEVDPGEEAPLYPTPAPEPAPEAATRPRRRMNLDQLAAAMRQVSGGIGWTEIRSGREVDLFVELSATLGKPDYIQVTNEDLEPSALFQKFLDDAARSVCQGMAERADEADAALLPHVDRRDTVASAPAAVDENLRALLRRFHGRAVAPGAPDLDQWRWLFESATFVTGDPLDGWRVVCVGLFTHPDFYTY